jgi:hypothetical protein
MAYDFIPTKASQIYSHPKLKPSVAVASSMVDIFDYLLKLDPKIEDPIAIDAEKKAVKILPSFEKKVNLTTLKNKLKLKVKVDFGRGSRGINTKSSDKMKPGKATASESESSNKGIQFELDLIKALNEHFKGTKLTTQKYKKPFIDCIDSIEKKYKLANKDVQVIPEGGLNKKRPLTFMGDTIYVGGSNFKIGSTVTDITLKAQEERKQASNVYLSLKYGPKVTFFNAGVARILSKQELQSGKIKNEQGRAILELFGIEPTKFAAVFDPTVGKVTTGPVDTFKKIDVNKIQSLIKSGVGYGYHLVHMEKNGAIHDIEMTSSQLEKSSTPQSCIIHYGGASGTAKRVDIYVETPMFSLQFNFRNKARGGVYPSHLMCDYKIKH